MVSELFEFNSAVRGYHYYQKYWQPEENKRLFCAHEADNPYDCFASEHMWDQLEKLWAI